MAKDKKTTENKPIEGELLEYNPLLGSQAITPTSEMDTKVSVINEIESLAVLNKQHLMAKRQQVELEVDNQKLDVALKTVSTIDKIIQSVADEEVLTRVASNINTPQDMKYMTEAAEKLTGTLKNLMNPNVADEFGNRKHHKINMMFKGQGAVSIELPKE